MENHSVHEKPPVVFVPGGVMPAEISYGPLLRILGDRIQPILKDLELYATDAPPPGYSLDLEVEGIRRAADAAGAAHFHLVGYSAGGAACLAFAARYPERLLSLALIEPAWIGRWTAEDAPDWAELNWLMQLPPEEQMPAFQRWQMRPGVNPPSLPQPPGPPPAWMAKRPAGLKAVFQAFNGDPIDQERFRLLHRPVYFVLGSLSTRFYERAAALLAGLFPDLQVEEYAGRSHFDPPQRAEPDRLARALIKVWMGEKVV